MKMIGLVFAVAILLGLSVVFADENFDVETARQGDKDIITVTNGEGKIVSTSVVYTEDKYQLLKPNDENDYVCLISVISEKDDAQSQCYARVPLSEDTNFNLKLEDCEDREIFFLQPEDQKNCGNAAVASKRGYPYCKWIHEVQCVCLEHERFCKATFFFCIAWGTRCKRYGTRVVTTQICY